MDHLVSRQMDAQVFGRQSASGRTNHPLKILNSQVKDKVDNVTCWEYVQ